jgi:hypothetical protein
MRLPIICSHCMREDPKSAQPFTLAEWNGEGRYEAICQRTQRNNHSSRAEIRIMRLDNCHNFHDFRGACAA